MERAKVAPCMGAIRGRIRPQMLAGGAIVAALAVVALGWLLPGGESLADVERRLQARDRYAQFVDRPAPGFALTGVDRDSVRLDDFSGRIVILNFVYARCTDICLPHMAVISDLQDRIERLGLSNQVEFVSLATDTEPAAETAGFVSGYGERFGLESGNWRMLYRGERAPRAVIDLAADYGLEFHVVMGDGGDSHAEQSDAVDRQLHGAVTHVIGPAGRLRARFHGLRFEPDTFTAYVQALVERETAQ